MEDKQKDLPIMSLIKHFNPNNGHLLKHVCVVAFYHCKLECFNYTSVITSSLIIMVIVNMNLNVIAPGTNTQAPSNIQQMPKHVNADCFHRTLIDHKLGLSPSAV